VAFIWARALSIFDASQPNAVAWSQLRMIRVALTWLHRSATATRALFGDRHPPALDHDHSPERQNARTPERQNDADRTVAAEPAFGGTGQLIDSTRTLGWSRARDRRSSGSAVATMPPPRRTAVAMTKASTV